MSGAAKVDAQRQWASAMAYSRAVRRGPLIEVSGTTATSPTGNALHPNDAYSQAQHALAAIVDAIGQLGGSADDVIRTRIFLTDTSDWEAVGRAHDEVFHDVAPASTIVEVSGFLLPELLVEIEATAYIAVESESR